MSKNSIPKYRQIKYDIEAKITSGHYLPGDMIPGENELAKQYDVSVITTRRALEILSNKGLLERKRGKGTFVVENRSTPSKMNKDIVTFILLSYDLSDSATMQLVNGAYTILTDQDKSLVVEYSRNDPKRERQLLLECLEGQQAGVLLFSSDPQGNLPTLKELKDSKLPFVLIDRGVTGFPVNLVSCYNFEGAYLMGRHLMDQGHRRIMFVGSDEKILTERQRRQGLLSAIEEIDKDLELFTCFSFYEHPLAILEYLHLNSITAIFCVNDFLAYRVMDILKENKIRIPEDISVAGFDDSDMSKYTDPPLTTVRQNFREIGKVSARLLVDLMKNPGQASTQYFLPTELVIRNSTKVVNNGR